MYSCQCAGFSILSSLLICILESLQWIINFHASHRVKFHDREKAFISSYQEIYFGHVRALPLCLALLCFVLLLCTTSKIALSVVYYAEAPSTWSCWCLLSERGLKLCREVAGWVKGFAVNNRNRLHLVLLEREDISCQLRSIYFFSVLCVCFLCYISTLLCFPFSWAQHWKWVIPVRETPTKHHILSVQSSWSTFRNAVLGSYLERSSFFSH